MRLYQFAVARPPVTRLLLKGAQWVEPKIAATVRHLAPRKISTSCGGELRRLVSPMNCPHCNRPLIKIDYYGEVLVGCVECNRWADLARRRSSWNC